MRWALVLLFLGSASLFLFGAVRLQGSNSELAESWVMLSGLATLGFGLAVAAWQVRDEAEREPDPIAATLGILDLTLAMLIGAGVLLGLLVSVWCPEYFLLVVVPPVNSKWPLILGMIWGVMVGGLAGLVTGTLLAFVARMGSKPPLSARQLVMPIVRNLGLVLVVGLAAGWVFYVLGTARMVLPPSSAASQLAFARLGWVTAFHGSLWTMLWAYPVAVVLLCRGVWRRRALLSAGEKTSSA